MDSKKQIVADFYEAVLRLRARYLMPEFSRSHKPKMLLLPTVPADYAHTLCIRPYVGSFDESDTRVCIPRIHINHFEMGDCCWSKAQQKRLMVTNTRLPFDKCEITVSMDELDKLHCWVSELLHAFESKFEGRCYCPVKLGVPNATISHLSYIWSVKANEIYAGYRKEQLAREELRRKARESHAN